LTRFWTVFLLGIPTPETPLMNFLTLFLVKLYDSYKNIDTLL
jgi:hypothetical protein